MPDDSADLTEPRWPAMFSALGIAGAYFALPDSMNIGPPWILLVLVIVLLVPTVISHRRRHRTLNDLFGYGVLAVTTVALLGAVVKLVIALKTHEEQAIDLLRSAAVLWMTNVLVFASWYWRLDAGGPNERDDRRRGRFEHPQTKGAFLFPQMTIPADPERAPWHPEFADYLFIAFNTSTAFSPTDAPVLSRWAKLLMMLQALISFTSIVLLAARAVNML